MSMLVQCCCQSEKSNIERAAAFLVGTPTRIHAHPHPRTRTHTRILPLLKSRRGQKQNHFSQLTSYVRHQRIGELRRVVVRRRRLHFQIHFFILSPLIAFHSLTLSSRPSALGHSLSLTFSLFNGLSLGLSLSLLASQYLFGFVPESFTLLLQVVHLSIPV